MQNLVLNSLKIYFDSETTNKTYCDENEIVVFLGNGSKAKITIKKQPK